jgi:C4-dicarboxylate transporter DctM subunit
MCLSIPFGFALLLGITVGTLLFDPGTLQNLISQSLDNVNDPLLIGIPMLIIGGEMLSAVGAIDPIVDLLDGLIGRVRGCLGLVCVATSMFFAGSTGSSAAEAAAVASAFRDPMKQRGYPTRYVAPLITASTAIGILFPPSLALVLYASIVNYPVTELWKAGILPGIMTGVLIAIVGVILGRRATAPAAVTAGATADRADAEAAADVDADGVAASTTAAPSLARTMVSAAVPVTAGAGALGGPLSTSPLARPARADRVLEPPQRPGRDGGPIRRLFTVFGGVAMPVVVVGGIYSGILTLTETAAVLVALVILYGFLVTRIGGRRMLNAARRGGERAGAIFLILVAARLFSTVLTYDQSVPALINWVNGLGLNKWELLAVINIALIVAGIFMDSLSLIVIAAPILYQMLSPLGISPVHLAIIMAMNIEIGVIHPPFGGNLFAVSAVTQMSVGRIAKGVIPYIGVLLLMLVLVTYVPVPGFQWN